MRSARARLGAGLVAALAAGAGTGLTLARAQDAGKLLKCPAIQDATARLACFDDAMKPAPNPSAAQGNATPAPTPMATTAPRPAARVVQADDAFVTPNKYVGQAIEIPRMKCLYADKGEYRCLGSGNLAFAVFVKAIGPQDQRDGIERDCGELSQVLTSPLCLKTVRFIPAKVVNDIVSGFQQRVILQAEAAELDDAKPAARPASARR